MKKRNLTKNTKLKYERIIDEWFINKFEGTKACRKFYPNIKKDSTAQANFSRIKALPEMKLYIQAKHEEAARIIDATHEGILRKLITWLELDITDTIGLSGDEIKLLPIDLRQVITKHKSRFKHFYDKDGNLLNTEETIEVHFMSKERLLDMINKHIGFYEADNRQKIPQIDYESLNVGTLINLWDARRID